MADQTLTHSALWKSVLLSTDSTFFPRLVEAAAWFHGKEYTAHLLRSVAVNPELLGAIEMPVNEGVDAILTEYATNPETAGGMDQLILAAVEAYEEPADRPGSSQRSRAT